MNCPGHFIGENTSQNQLTWHDVKAWQPDQGVLWIHLDAANETTLTWLEGESGLSPLIQEALLELGTRPRSMATESGLLAIFRGVNCNPGADPEDMVAIRMFLFLPLGLLTGLLGINVGGIPGTEYRWAFTLVALSLVVIAVGLVVWFRKIKWL